MDMPVLEAPKKNNKTGAIIGTVVAVLLCGCPGLAAACWGLVSAVASQIPGADINIGGSSDPNTALMVGIASLCGGVIFIAIPVIVGVLTLRKKKGAAGEVVPVTTVPPTTPQEPLPPAS